MEPLGSFPRVLNVLPREKIEGPPRDFLKANPRPHPRPDQRPKPEGPQAPRVFGLWSGRGCGQGFAFRKFQRGPSIFFRRSTLSNQGTSRGSIHHDTSEAFQQIFILSNQRTWRGASSSEFAACRKHEIVFLRRGPLDKNRFVMPREYRGEYTRQKAETLTQLNRNILVRW